MTQKKPRQRMIETTKNSSSFFHDSVNPTNVVTINIIDEQQQERGAVEKFHDRVDLHYRKNDDEFHHPLSVDEIIDEVSFGKASPRVDATFPTTTSGFSPDVSFLSTHDNTGDGMEEALDPVSPTTNKHNEVATTPSTLANLVVETDFARRGSFNDGGTTPEPQLQQHQQQPLTPNFPLDTDSRYPRPVAPGVVIKNNVITFVDVQDGNESASPPPPLPSASSSSGLTPPPTQLSSTGASPQPTSPSPDDLRDQETGMTLTPEMTGMTLTPPQRLPVSRSHSSRRSSHSSQESGSEIVRHHPVFVRDTSQFWYKPLISREDAIAVLKAKAPGTFIVRDSNSFPGAYGLAIKVATLPPNIAAQHQRRMKMEGMTDRIPSPTPEDLVRHFLIEPTPRGVRLKGCLNEPTFASLAALVYQHSITRLALPCELLLPTCDPVEGIENINTAAGQDGRKQSLSLCSSPSHLLSQGAACKVLYLNSVDMESLTGPQAVKKAMNMTLDNDPAPPTPTVVHFKVSAQGITLTDNQRKVFFRRHYPVNSVTYCGVDPEDKRCFGFVARKDASGIRDARHNQCHVFAALEPDQPASAIVNFVTKVMIGGSSSQRLYTH